MTYANLKRLDFWLWTQGGQDILPAKDLTNDNLVELTNDAGDPLQTD